MVKLASIPNDQAQNSADNIIKIINAAAAAKTSQTELEKTLMLDQISRKRNLEDKAAESQQQFNMWSKFADQGGQQQGVADSQTANQVGSNPSAPVGYGAQIQAQQAQMPQGGYNAQQPPPMSMPDGSTSPGAQQEQMQQPQAQPQAQPPVPAGVAIESPIGTPLPPPKGRISIGPSGPSMRQLEPKDGVYSQIYNKWRSGQPLSDGEGDFVKEYLGMGNSVKFQEKQDQFNQKEWDKLTKEVNPLTTSGRNPLGMAMKANYNANRAISTLQNPMVTKQEAGNVMADIASIYQNGSPTQFGMHEQGYNSIQQSLASAKQYITGKPQDALPPDIKNRLLDVLYSMKKTNFDVVKQNLDYTEKAKSKLIKSFPQEWQDMRGTLLSDAYSGLDQKGSVGDQGMVQKMQQARDAGYSEEEIQQFLQGKK